MFVNDDFLNKFRFSVLNFQLKTLEDLILPEFSGSTLRGAFGNTLKNICCTQKKHDCHQCLLITSCPFGYIFSTPSAKESTRLRNLQDIPRPYVIRPNDITGGKHKEGSILDFEQVIIGRAIDYLPYFIVAFKEMGEEGIGKEKGRYKLITVTAKNPHKSKYETLYNSEKGDIIYNEEIKLRWIDILDYKDEELYRIEINFVTPLRLETQGLLLEWAPEFEDLIIPLSRRINNLAYFHCNILEELNFADIKKRAYGVEIADAEIKTVNWSRYSEHQNRKIPMKGIIGKVVYEGDLTSFKPLLKLGEYINLGKNTTMGLGRISLSI